MNPLVPLVQVGESFVAVEEFQAQESDDHWNWTVPVLSQILLVISSVQTLLQSFDAYQDAFDVDVVELQVDNVEAFVVVAAV